MNKRDLAVKLSELSAKMQAETDKEIRDKLFNDAVNESERFIHSVINDVAVSTETTPYDDIYNDALMGLFTALMKYDACSKTSILTYVYTCVKNEIYMTLRRLSVGPNGHTLNKYKEMKRIEEEHGESGLIAAGYSKDTLRNYRSYVDFDSIPLQYDDPHCENSIYCDSKENDVELSVDLQRAIESIRDRVDKRSFYILSEHVVSGKSYSEIGRELNLSRERVRVMYNEILKRLSNEMLK